MQPIEFYVEGLTGAAKRVASEFVAFLRARNVEFYQDLGSAWKDKIYYWVKQGEECLCFLAFQDPDEPENQWTVWSDECDSYAAEIPEDEIRNIAWRHIDFCGHCGSCKGGTQKTVFGRTFDRVCGCTFRVDNPTEEDLPFLKKMIELRIRDIVAAKGRAQKDS